jgi:hypothetical protein
MQRPGVNQPWLPRVAAMMALVAVNLRAEEPALPEAIRPRSPMRALSGPVERPPLAALHPGTNVTIRIRQVFPCDGLSPGERLLNGRPPIQPGDRFLADVIHPTATPPPLVGGRIVAITPPRRFGRPGHFTLQLTQCVESRDGTERLLPWLFDTEDRRFSTRAERKLLTSLMGLEGASVGASLGAQLLGRASANPVMVTGGAGIGLILGVGYASFRRGVEASLEQGDSFEVVVGTTSYRPVPRTVLTTLFPAPDPSRGKGKSKTQGHP